MPTVEVPHFDLPFRFEGGRAVVNDQDSLDEIACCVEAILRYPLGYRAELPEFGIPDYSFEIRDIDEDTLRELVEQWEERADLAVEREGDPFDEGMERLNVSVGGGI